MSWLKKQDYTKKSTSSKKVFHYPKVKPQTMTDRYQQLRKLNRNETK